MKQKKDNWRAGNRRFQDGQSSERFERGLWWANCFDGMARSISAAPRGESVLQANSNLDHGPVYGVPVSGLCSGVGCVRQMALNLWTVLWNCGLDL